MEKITTTVRIDKDLRDLLPEEVNLSALVNKLLRRYVQETSS
jgi:hypothetical protein